MSGVNKQAYEEDMNIWGWGRTEGIKQQGKGIQSYFSLYIATRLGLACVCMHIHAQMSGPSVINITEKHNLYLCCAI